MYLSLLAIFVCIATYFVSSAGKIQLPYEVQETLLNLMTVDDLERIDNSDSHSIRPFYRKDLDSSYIAYYEVINGENFRVLSAGPKTGEEREVESGPVPSPSQVLIDQAEGVRQKCKTFYRLAVGLYMCENRQNTVVATTFDWIADSPVQDWRNLHQKVQKSLPDFKTAWKKIAASMKNEWTTSRRISSNEDPPASALYDAEIISPGSTALVPLEHDFGNITIHAIEHERQNQLCRILVKACKGEKLGMNSELIHKLKNGISFIKLDIQEDKNFVKQVLHNQDVSFYVKIETRGEMILKYFSVDLSRHRQRRWNQWSEWSIDREDLFPDYSQHKCCGCASGCGPVAWAQILAYYDRLAHYSPSSNYSKHFWECSDGTADNCTAPKNMNSNVKRYVEGIRSKLGTFCLLGGGATTPKKMKKISDWYHARDIQGRIDSRYKFLSLIGMTYPSFKKTAVSWLKERYPVILGFWTKGFSMHYAVATQYKERQRKYRKCFFRRCRNKVKVEGSFYLHMGWGGKSNGWYSKNTFAVYAAKKN